MTAQPPNASLMERFVRHRVAANLVMIMMILAGAWAVRHVTTQFDPDVQWPGIWVEIHWPGAGAEDVEQMITIPVQQQLRTIADIKEVRSITTPGQSRMIVEMDHETDLTRALDSVKQQVANVRNLPADIEPPLIYVDRNLEDIATLLVTGPDDLAELIPLVRGFERQLRGRGVAEIQLRGLPEQELAIMVGTEQLTALSTTLTELGNDIARLSADVPAGTVGRAQGARQLRGLDQQRSVAGFSALELGRDGELLRLADIAQIEHRSRDDQIQVRKQGRPAIEMVLLRSRGTDAFFAAELVDDWLEATRPGLPQGVELTLTWEARDFLADQLTLIGKNGATGLVLVIGVLLLFLGGRVAGWVTLGIPVSFALALAIYWGVFDGSINILALIAFIMATGIVVDDAIV
ncbi:MAG: efflux RND transporter permease subunit, partial [Gammaproteobacteria bacterium]|nr:efflux RND transporter permease subunit [Gammaproteobacteria bacterium]